jgi:hypothetical protein
MIISPYKTPAPAHAVGFVMPSGRVVMEDGSRWRIGDLPPNAHASRYASVKLYADHHTIVSRFAMRGVGELDMFNGSWFAWWPDPDHRVTLLKDDPGNGGDVLEGLVTFRNFLAARGASIGSLGHSTRSLLRATLREPLRTGVGVEGPKGIIPDNIGGRQESYLPAGYYPSFLHVDLVAAYAQTLGHLHYDPGSAWTEHRGAFLPDTPTPVIARAHVRFPAGLGVGPLPRRLRHEAGEFDTRDWPITGEMTGTYTADELRAAIEVGCDVKIERVWWRTWREDADVHPFARWWRAIRQARDLPGYAGHLGKMAGAALWGTFIGNGDLYRIHYTESAPDRWRRLRKAALDRRHVGYDLAELVTSRVRTRLHRELIVPAHAAGRLIGVHTDGGLLIDHPPMPDLGHDWVTKYAGRLEYITPAAFRFKTGAEHRWHYVMAGVADDQAPGAFADKWRWVRGAVAQGYAGSLQVREREGERRLVEAFPEFADQLERMPS